MSSGQNKNRKTEIIETGMFRAAEIEIIKNGNEIIRITIHLPYGNI